MKDRITNLLFDILLFSIFFLPLIIYALLALLFMWKMDIKNAAISFSFAGLHHLIMRILVRRMGRNG